jgi:ketosteroid isomerase-like protein
MQPKYPENSKSLGLPNPVATYLAAEKAKDLDMLARCFAEDALVHDEGRDYRGLDAIRSWKQEADRKYQYVMEPLDVSVNDDTVKLRARLTGNFPGSPVDLDFTFTLANDKITSLNIE